MTEKPINARDVVGSVISNGFVGGSISVNSINNITSEEKQNLAEAAAEIQQLLAHLSQSYPTTTITDRGNIALKAMEEIEKKPDTKAKIIKALKAGGVAALIEITNNPIVKILTPMLESLLEDSK